MDKKRNFRPDTGFALVSLATVSTALVHYHALQGTALTLTTALLWVVAVTLAVAPDMLGFEGDPPTTLMRYLAFGVLLVVLKALLMLEVHDTALATVLLLGWRWIDVALMWRNWHRVTA